MCTEIGSILGVIFYVDDSPREGFRVIIRDEETHDTLYNELMLLYSIREAVIIACSKVWKSEIEDTKDYDLPLRIAENLGLEEWHSSVSA